MATPSRGCRPKGAQYLGKGGMGGVNPGWLLGEHDLNLAHDGAGSFDTIAQRLPAESGLFASPYGSDPARRLVGFFIRPGDPA